MRVGFAALFALAGLACGDSTADGSGAQSSATTASDGVAGHDGGASATAGVAGASSSGGSLAPSRTGAPGGASATGGAPASGGAAATAGADVGGAGGGGLSVEPAIFTIADAPLVPITEGASVPLMLPPQGGYVLFVGARLRHVSTDTIKLRAKLLDPTTGALVAEDLRTVVLQPVPGEPGVFMTDNRTYSQHANVTLCPDWSGRAIHEQTVTLVLEVTELYVDAAVPVAVTRAIVPTCAAGPTGDECRCQCAAGFELGKCH